MQNYDDIKIDTQAIIDEVNREPSPDYPQISIKGKNKYSGLTKCESFLSRGSLEVESVECLDEFNVGGKTRCFGNISAKNIYSKGTFYCDGEISVARGSTGCFGKFTATKKVKSRAIALFGKAELPEGAESDDIYIAGCAKTGVLEAKKVEIYSKGKTAIESIKGKEITISVERKGLKKVPPFSLFVKNCVVNSQIDGDEVTLERLTCPLVIGSEVVIGDGCQIDHVKYSKDIKVSPKAKVGKTEKI